ncbi:hypothetical protein CAOG_00802 [Capsaspora owczarzaki ATCC 30864]|uniref:Uncharacterized protein n=1 Tax=Capsaspora owczarzaki (strain ATCC 30864) TaxID=595528 RepID=A0A0D2WJ64_CAPO3|nr:hypothetical protein CAOG_00802 [Capsaspora owczarzaki ATCC 30864]KJE89303.1 hypothetical protein CAOG_000802 [Capsaspora owczarzaki ATCC 30864]KJE89304.1 hypothetical protein, variant [Capsaspora owczarzaki ATCC 30864]|eukprot:XP_004365673.1 hypothetical protein CAOG_00802 [Capsaspora owczarzaki ATCC 30864]
MAAVIVCPEPYISPNCTETFGEHLGAAPIVTHSIYGALVAVLCTLAVYNLYMVVRYKNGWSLDIQNIVLYFVVYGAFGMLLRAFDPMSWYGIVPYWVNSYAYATSTACCFAMFFSMVWSWMGFVSKTTFRPWYRKFLNRVYIGSLIVIFFVSYLALILKFTHVLLTWEGDVVVFIMLITLNVVWSSAGAYHGTLIWRTLRASYKRFGYSSTSGQDDSSHPPVTGSSVPGELTTRASTTAANADKVKQKMMRKRAHALRRIAILNFLSIGVGLIAIGVIAYGIGSRISAKRDIDTNPMDPPTIGTLIQNYQFDIIHFVVMFPAIFFFRYARPQRTTEDVDIDMSSTSHGRNTKHEVTTHIDDEIELEEQVDSAGVSPALPRAQIPAVARIKEEEATPSTSSTDRMSVHSTTVEIMNSSASRLPDAEADVEHFQQLSLADGANVVVTVDSQSSQHE